MEDILKLAEENQIEKIIECIKKEKTNEERDELIMQLPDDIKIQLIGRIEELYIMEGQKQSGFKTLKRDDLLNQYANYIIASLSDENMLNYLKGKNDKVKVGFVTDVTVACPNDNIKLKVIDIIEDFAYKVLIASRIQDKELRQKVMAEIGVSDILLEMIEGAYELESTENKKYKSIGIYEEAVFGIEIEGANHVYAELLKEMGNFPGDICGWTWKNDTTITENEKAENGIDYGLEVSSPILKDNEETVQQIYTVCNMMQKLGTRVNELCGGHIHFGIEYFETPKELWNLIEIYGKCEGVFNLIINEAGTLPRDSLKRFAKSTYKKLLEENIDVNNFDDINVFIEEIKRIQGGKEYDINISNHGTVEFRAPNGSIKPEIWIENIKLFGKLIEVSKGLENNNMPKFDKKRSLLAQIKAEKDESVKCNLLLGLLFDDENERGIYRERFDANRSLQFGMKDFREMYMANENRTNPKIQDTAKEEK